MDTTKHPVTLLYHMAEKSRLPRPKVMFWYDYECYCSIEFEGEKAVGNGRSKMEAKYKAASVIVKRLLDVKKEDPAEAELRNHGVMKKQPKQTDTVEKSGKDKKKIKDEKMPAFKKAAFAVLDAKDDDETRQAVTALFELGN